MNPPFYITSRGLRKLADTLDALTKAHGEDGVDVAAYAPLDVAVFHYANQESETGHVKVSNHDQYGFVVEVQS